MSAFLAIYQSNALASQNINSQSIGKTVQFEAKRCVWGLWILLISIKNENFCFCFYHNQHKFDSDLILFLFLLYIIHFPTFIEVAAVHQCVWWLKFDVCGQPLSLHVRTNSYKMSNAQARQDDSNTKKLHTLTHRVPFDCFAVWKCFHRVGICVVCLFCCCRWFFVFLAWLWISLNSLHLDSPVLSFINIVCNGCVIHIDSLDPLEKAFDWSIIYML